MVFLIVIGIIFLFAILIFGTIGLIEIKKDEERERQVLKMVLKDCPPYGSGRHDWSIDPRTMALVCTKCDTKAGEFNE